MTEQPCPVCTGRVVTVDDPDDARKPAGRRRKFTYCVECATIFSPTAANAKEHTP